MTDAKKPNTETPADAAKPADLVPIDAKLLEQLVCPMSLKPLEYDRANNRLISRQAGVAFPIRGGIPLMLEDEAVPL